MTRELILTLTCPDAIGIVAGVAGFLAERGGNIQESAQYGDPASRRFFMRVRFGLPEPASGGIANAFAAVAERFAMRWEMIAADHRPRILLLVSRFGHCLVDLVHRCESGLLKADIAAIVSNHRDFERLAESHGVPFVHLPVTPATKAAQEAALLDIVAREGVELVVLARYMQVLSPELCGALAGRAINIHHSFLPSFKGARPYHQAHERGVKLIGATAHYVTADLDEGPIIDQDVTRADHAMSPEDLVAAGRDVESTVLGRAVKFHLERRVLPNGHRTVVFR